MLLSTLAAESPLDFELVLPPPRPGRARRARLIAGIALFLGILAYGMWLLAPPSTVRTLIPRGWQPGCREIDANWQTYVMSGRDPRVGFHPNNGRWIVVGPTMVYLQSYVGTLTPDVEGGWEVLLPLDSAADLATDAVSNEVLCAAVEHEGVLQVVSMSPEGLVLTSLDPVALTVIDRRLIASPVTAPKRPSPGGYREWAVAPLANGRLGVLGRDPEGKYALRYLVLDLAQGQTELALEIPRTLGMNRRFVRATDGSFILQGLVGYPPPTWGYLALDPETGKTSPPPPEWTFPVSKQVMPKPSRPGSGVMPSAAAAGRSNVDLDIVSEYVWDEVDLAQLQRQQVSRNQQLKFRANNFRWAVWRFMLGRDGLDRISSYVKLLPIQLADARDPADPLRRLEGDLGETLQAAMDVGGRERGDWKSRLLRFYRIDPNRLLVAQLIPSRARADAGPSLLRFGTLEPDSRAVAWHGVLTLPSDGVSTINGLEVLDIVPQGSHWFIGVAARGTTGKPGETPSFVAAWTRIAAPMPITPDVEGSLLDISSYR